MRERVYLAGPITGHDLNERVAYFATEKKQLEAQGYEVVNPLEVHPLGIPWEDALRADLRELVTCDAIYLTPGWEKSRGVQLELHVALALGLRVMFKPKTEIRGVSYAARS